MQSQHEALRVARDNVIQATMIATELRNSSHSEETRELAEAVRRLGLGAQEAIQPMTAAGKTCKL